VYFLHNTARSSVKRKLPLRINNFSGGPHKTSDAPSFSVFRPLRIFLVSSIFSASDSPSNLKLILLLNSVITGSLYQLFFLPKTPIPHLIGYIPLPLPPNGKSKLLRPFLLLRQARHTHTSFVSLSKKPFSYDPAYMKSFACYCFAHLASS
jgi:hypothetical protein